jgi:hypothetical protein
MNPEFRVHPLEVGLDGPHSNHQFLSDLAAGETARNQISHFTLAVYHGRKRTAISECGERQFRTKSYTDLGRSRTVVSADAEHLFRLMANSPGS